MADLISTGIDGLDTLLDGGLRPGSCTIIEGEPGTGKTTIGLNCIYEGCIRGEAGVIVTFEQLPERIYADALNFGWDLRELEQRGLLRVICTSPDVFLDQLADAEGLIDSLIREMDGRHILVDSVSHLAQASDAPQQLRSMTYSMFNGLKRAGLTSLVTKEVGSALERGTSVAEYMSDTVIDLSFEMGPDFYRRRYIEVLKCRGQNHAYGKHTLKLSNDGPVIYPRLAERPPKQNLPTAPVSSGVVGLDQMLAGGLRSGYTVLVAGSAGVGKTTLGLSFIGAGAAVGDAAVYVTFEEAPASLAQMGDNYGLQIRQMLEDGSLSIMHFPPVHLRTDELIAQLEAEIVRIGATRVVIDSITDLALAGQDAQRLRETVYIISAMLKQHGVTAMLTTEVPELFGQTRVTTEHISMIVDGIILMKYVEMESEIQRALSVLKMRGSAHDKDIRRFAIDGGGIHVRSRFEGTEGVMAGSARPVTIALSVRSFSEMDAQHNQELMARFAQTNPRVASVSLSLPYNPDEAFQTVRGALETDRSELSVAPLCLYWMSAVHQMNRLHALDDLLAQCEIDQHIPALVEAGTSAGNLFAVPALSACGVLLYREDLLEEAGFTTPPTTWDELIEQARTVMAQHKSSDLIGYQFPAYLYEGLTTSFLQNLWSNGGRIYDGSGVSLQNEVSLEALQYMYDLVFAEEIVPRSCVTATAGLEPQRDFVEGRTLFLTMLPSVAQAAQRPDSPVRGRVGITRPPVGPHGTESHTFLSGWLYGIPLGAQAPEAARQFIRFMTNTQIQKERALRGGPLPTIEALYTDPEVLAFNPDYPAIREMLGSARRRTDIPNYLEVSRAIQAHLHAMLKNETPPSQCFEAMRADVARLTDAR